MTLARRRAGPVLGTGLLLILALAVVEAVAYGIHAATVGEPFSAAGLSAERAAVVRGAAAAGDAGDEIPHYLIHPFYGYVANPRHPSWPTAYGPGTVSPLGFIDPPAPPAQGRPPARVAVIGGSLAAHFVGAGSAALTDRLRRLPAFAGREIVLVRLALGGFKQPQQLLALNHLFALGTRFDLIVELDGFNEITLAIIENVPKDIAPEFPRSWYFFTESSLPVSVVEILGERRLLMKRRKQLAAGFPLALRYSVTANLTWKLLDRRYATRALEAALKAERARVAAVSEATAGMSISESGRVSFGPRPSFKDRREYYEAMAALWARSSLLMHDAAAAQGIPYVHFLQPNQYAPGSKPLSKEELRFAIAERPFKEHVVSGYPYLRAAGGFLAEQGVAFHDLTFVFAGEGDTLYVDTCCHLNEEGYRRLGARMGDAIARDFPGGRPRARVVNADVMDFSPSRLRRFTGPGWDLQDGSGVPILEGPTN